MLFEKIVCRHSSSSALADLSAKDTSNADTSSISSGGGGGGGGSGDGNTSSDDDDSLFWTRILSIQSKFVVKNKSTHDLRAKIVDSHATSITENRVHRFLDTEAKKIIKRDAQCVCIDTVLNMRNFYLKENEVVQAHASAEYDALKVNT